MKQTTFISCLFDICIELTVVKKSQHGDCMDGSRKSFTWAAGLVWWGPDLEGHIHGK